MAEFSFISFTHSLWHRWMHSIYCHQYSVCCWTYLNCMWTNMKWKWLNYCLIWMHVPCSIVGSVETAVVVRLRQRTLNSMMCVCLPRRKFQLIAFFPLSCCVHAFRLKSSKFLDCILSASRLFPNWMHLNQYHFRFVIVFASIHFWSIEKRRNNILTHFKIPENHITCSVIVFFAY